MNSRILYPSLFSMILSLSCLAQRPSKATGEIETSRYYQHRLFAKVNFISLLDPQTPTLQTGIEYRFRQRLAGELTLGIPMRMSEARATDTTYSHHYKIKAELRFFPARSLFYLGPEVFFTKKKRSRYDGVYRDKDAETYSYTFAELDKTIVGFAIKAGRVFELSEKWCLDGFVAMGTRYIHLDVKAQGVQQAQGYRWLYWTRDTRGSTMGLHLACGLKVGYAIH